MVNNKSNSRFEFVEKLLNVPNSKRSQITIFIILALVIVAVLILIFLGRDRLPNVFVEEAPIDQIKSCVKNAAVNASAILRVQGGSINPTNYYSYQGYKVDYLCYTEENYKACVNQKPLLRQTIEEEFINYLIPKVNKCIEDVKTSLENKGYEVSSKKPAIGVSIVPEDISVSLKDINLVIKKTNVETYKTIKIDLDSKLYDFIMITSSIVNWEARYGDSESMNYMVYYPDLKVEKKKQSEGTTIYILTNRDSKENFIFATKSYTVPPGILGN